MTLRLTDDETEALRARAAREGRSMQDVARRAVRDVGLLGSALPRPQSSAFGEPAYPDLHTHAAALMHSLARNHVLVEGKKRFALTGTIAFLGLNGERLALRNEEAYDLVMVACQGHMEEINDLVSALRTEPR